MTFYLIKQIKVNKIKSKNKREFFYLILLIHLLVSRHFRNRSCHYQD